MAFHYSRRRPSQHLLIAVVLLLAIGLGALPCFARAWAAMVGSWSDFMLLVLGPWAIHLVVFWTFALGCSYVDTFDRPRWIARYRIQDGPRRRPRLGKVLRVLGTNQLLWSPVMLSLTAWALLARGWTASTVLPGLAQLLAELAGLSVVAVLVFYATHRFLHRPWWMRKVHKVHHEFFTTTAMASEYAHPVEFCIGNFGTLAVGVVLLAPSLAAIYLFTVVALITILVHHSGYAVPWAPWPIHHDWHHYRVVEMFGTTGLLDKWLRTEGRFADLHDGDVR